MALSIRTRMSLVQYLLEFTPSDVRVLFKKHGLISTDSPYFPQGREPLSELYEHLAATTTEEMLQPLLDEIAFRHTIDDEWSKQVMMRWQDLVRCMALDGFIREVDEFERPTGRWVRTDPIIEGADFSEDDLTKTLRTSGLPSVANVVKELDASAQFFRGGKWGDCLNHARIALDELAKAIHTEKNVGKGAKWGARITDLKPILKLSSGEEEGLTGVFSYLSEAAHSHLGFDAENFARHGRQIALPMIYFLVRRYVATK